MTVELVLVQTVPATPEALVKRGLILDMPYGVTVARLARALADLPRDAVLADVTHDAMRDRLWIKVRGDDRSLPAVLDGQAYPRVEV